MSDPYDWPQRAVPTTENELLRALARSVRDMAETMEARAANRPPSTRGRCVCASSMSSARGCDICLPLNARRVLAEYEATCRDADQFAREEAAREMREAS